MISVTMSDKTVLSVLILILFLLPLDTTVCRLIPFSYRRVTPRTTYSTAAIY